MRTRRDLLSAAGAVLGTTAIAGCTAPSIGGSADPSVNDEEGDRDEGNGGETTPDASATATVDAAVAAEWNAMRARVWDAFALGQAGSTDAGGRVARGTFARFEGATGEYGAHEVLEATGEANYAEFEEALGELRTEGLRADDLGRAREEADIANTQLADAQRKLVGDRAANALDLQLLGATVQDAALVAAAGKFETAAGIAEDVLARFEDAAVHEAVEEAAPDAYERFESAVEAVGSAAAAGNAGAVRTKATAAYEAAIDGSYAVADAEAAAGAGHVATLQARGWDAAALASMGGPSTDYAHAAALTLYRARAYDARWLAARGATDRAATMTGDVFAHFEGARAHEALEDADHEAYEGFEAGLGDLQEAIENGDAAAVDDAVARVDENLVAGVTALAGAAASLLEAAFFRARFADAFELYRLGASDAAVSLAESLFGRFEENELDFHETVESTSEDLYHRFEEKHLGALVDAFEDGDDEAVRTHYDGVRSTLLAFEEQAGSAAAVSGTEAAFVGARGYDAAVLDALGKDSRAKAIAQGTFEHFEAGAGGYHEALEEADHEAYETFEDRLGAISSAAADGAEVYPKSEAFDAAVLDSAYAIVGTAGGSHADAAATVLQDAFAHFEESRVHEMLEDADRSAYHTFEGELDAYLTALQEGGDVPAAAGTFADAAQYAQFALVDAVEDLPLDLTLAGSGGEGGEDAGEGGESNLQGGPNVVEGVPEDADHVIDLNAVAFDPAELTVSTGDKVAWTHAAGEAHSVTAYEGKIPDGADYWASGDFDSQSAAKEGWEEGEGAVQSGHSFVRTFETNGTHEYFCIPHEAAGMTGSITVE